MTIIKLQSNRVVLRNGKAGCECCSGCCMYPATNYGTTFDLPDEIIFNGQTLGKSGTNYGNTINGVILEGGSWTRYVNGNVISRNSCLIRHDLAETICNDGIVRDNFSNSYYVSTPPTEGCPGGYYSGTVNRFNAELIACCAWGNENGDCGGQESNATLFYNSSDIIPGVPLNVWVIDLGVGGNSVIKEGNQNSPIGNYSGIGGAATVS